MLTLIAVDYRLRKGSEQQLRKKHSEAFAAGSATEEVLSDGDAQALSLEENRLARPLHAKLLPI